MKKYAVGVDVGGTTVKHGLFTTDGTVLKKWEIRTRKNNNGENILPDIAASIRKHLEEEGISLDDVEGVGIGLPGAAMEDGTVNKCVNLGWETAFNVADVLSGLLDGAKVKVGNDANVAALGEMWKGGGMGYKNLVMVTLGTGVGGGIIVNEKILTGTNGAAGEIGHMPVSVTETDTCGCGKQGCLEQYCSATGIVRMTNKKLDAMDAEINTELIHHANLSAKLVFDLAKEGDEVALEIVDEFGEYLGRGLAFVSCVTDPEVFVIGGGVSKAGQIVLDAIEKYYSKYAFHASRNTKFALATLGNDAGIYGSVKMVL